MIAHENNGPVSIHSSIQNARLAVITPQVLTMIGLEMPPPSLEMGPPQVATNLKARVSNPAISVNSSRKMIASKNPNPPLAIRDPTPVSYTHLTLPTSDLV